MSTLTLFIERRGRWNYSCSLFCINNSFVSMDLYLTTPWTLIKHINEICKSAFYHIRNISQGRRYLITESIKTLVHAFVTSWIDNCNALLYGLPSYLIQRLQYVLNSTARLISLSRKVDHITPLLIDLHWLPVEQRINFKFYCLHIR